MERQMDVMRERHHAQVSACSPRDLAGLLTVEKLAGPPLRTRRHRAWDPTLPCWRRISDPPPRQPRVCGDQLRQARRQASATPDLDIVPSTTTEAAEVPEVIRDSRSVSTWLSSQTAAGQLFERPTWRLRPNGGNWPAG